jgi:hypothetical protein
MCLDAYMRIEPAMASRALSTFAMPTRDVSCAICRCRLSSETVSSSTMPMVPTPAAARYISTGEPSPRPHHQHARGFQLLLALAAHLAQHEMPLVALYFSGVRAMPGCSHRLGLGTVYRIYAGGTPPFHPMSAAPQPIC